MAQFPRPTRPPRRQTETRLDSRGTVPSACPSCAGSAGSPVSRASQVSPSARCGHESDHRHAFFSPTRVVSLPEGYPGTPFLRRSYNQPRYFPLTPPHWPGDLAGPISIWASEFPGIARRKMRGGASPPGGRSENNRLSFCQRDRSLGIIQSSRGNFLFTQEVRPSSAGGVRPAARQLSRDQQEFVNEAAGIDVQFFPLS